MIKLTSLSVSVKPTLEWTFPALAKSQNASLGNKGSQHLLSQTRIQILLCCISTVTERESANFTTLFGKIRFSQNPVSTMLLLLWNVLNSFCLLQVNMNLCNLSIFKLH